MGGSQERPTTHEMIREILEESSLILIWVGLWNVVTILFNDESIPVNLSLAMTGVFLRCLLVYPGKNQGGKGPSEGRAGGTSADHGGVDPAE